jgi:hypothetical protein
MRFLLREAHTALFKLKLVKGLIRRYSLRPKTDGSLLLGGISFLKHHVGYAKKFNWQP